MSMATTRPVPAERESHRFYQTMAALCAAIAFLGFLPTYWAPLWQGTLSVLRIAHLHAVFFFSWTLFFMLQTWLVANGRTARHRELGLFGIALATAMLFTGTMVAIGSMNKFIALGFVDEARAFSLVPLSGIAYFAVVVAYAVANTRNPTVHKRAMVLATVSLLQPAVARWFVTFLAPEGATGQPPVLFTIVPGILSDLPLVYAMLHDWRTRGRPHKVYVIGAITLVAMQVLRVPVSATDTWLAIADWFSALSR